MHIDKFANVVSKLHGEIVPEIEGKKAEKYLFGPNVFIWNILEKKKIFHNNVL